jgi:hypothetical protein
MAEGERTGRVAELGRFPVKSMLGEGPSSVEVGEVGVVGDRVFALIDDETGKVASAKRPNRFASALGIRATYVDAVGPGEPLRFDLPDGSQVDSNAPDLDARLSTVIGRTVHLARAGEANATYEYEWADIEGVAPDESTGGRLVCRNRNRAAARAVGGRAAATGRYFGQPPASAACGAAMVIGSLCESPLGLLFAAQRAEPVLERLDPPQRLYVIMAIIFIVVIGLLLVTCTMLGARWVRGIARQQPRTTRLGPDTAADSTNADSRPPLDAAGLQRNPNETIQIDRKKSDTKVDP